MLMFMLMSTANCVTEHEMAVEDECFKSASTIGPGRGGTSYLTDFDETWPC